METYNKIAGNNTPKVESLTESQISGTEKRIEELAMIVATLEARLAPLCYPAHEANDSSGEAVEALPAIPARIRDLDIRLKNITLTLNSILSRITL